MDLPVHRVTDLACPSCGHALDPKALKPLTATSCPQCGADIAVPAQFDTFRLIRFLGAGGAGFVMEAFDEQLHRRVAIKVLRSGGDADKVAMEATREARSLAKLNHPSIVHIYSLGEYKDHKYIVMELLDGGSAKRFTDPAHRLDERATLDLAVSIADGLAAAQKVKLVHMDVKPGNILYDADGAAKLIDFGAAQFAKMRKSEGVVGTPYYIAPEVARGKIPDFKSDIYSLGATLFHLLTGHPPFDANDPKSVIIARLKRPAPAVTSIRSDVNPATAAVIGRMLAHDPDDRYESYDALLDDLRGARKAIDDPTGMSGAALSAAVSQPRHAALAERKHKGKIPAWAPVAIVALLFVGFIGIVALMLNAGPATATNNGQPHPPATPGTPDTPSTPDKPDTPHTPPGPAGATPPPNAGRLVRELWFRTPGASAEAVARSDLFDRAPDQAEYATSLALSVPVGEHYAQRLRGYLFAPYTGTYRFVLSADDSAAVYLAPDHDAKSRGKLVARSTTPMTPTQYTEPGESVELEAGKLYAMQIVHKQSAGSDHLVVGWVLPDGTRQTPIRSGALVPLTRGAATLETWDNVDAKSIADAVKAAESRKPDRIALVTRAAYTGDWPARRVVRIRGTLRVPADGKYIFELLADDFARLRLSDSDSPSAMRDRANAEKFAKPDDWSSAARANVDLEADRTYAFEVIAWGGVAPNFVHLGLRHPDGYIDRPIPGEALSPAE